MKFGLQLNPLVGTTPTARTYVEMAQHVEALGFSSLWVSDHVAIPKKITTSYPYSKDGSLGFPTDRVWLDVLSLIATLGACTQKLLFGTGVLVVPYREPVDLAKRIITADFLSNGRLLVGAGVGWLREEFEAVSVPFEERGLRTDESLRILIAMCSGGDSSFNGKIFKVPDLHVYPKPVQKPHPPLIIGGKGPAACRRIAELGNGWHPGPMPLEEFRAELGRIAAAMDAKGRKMSELRITLPVMLDHLTANRGDVETLEKLGVSEIVTMIPSAPTTDVGRAAVDQIAKTFLS